MNDETPRYYIKPDGKGFYELRQTRFRGQNHPHDVCAVAASEAELRAMAARAGLGPIEENQ